MSADINGSVADAGQPPIVVFEPRGDRPAREEPLIAPLMMSLVRRRRRALVLALLLLPLMALQLVVVGGSDAGALPVLAMIGAAALALVATCNWWHSRPAGWEKLLERPIRRVELAAADVRMTRSTAWLRVTAGPDELWIRSRATAALVGLVSARKGYVWILGPYSGGRVVAFLPGSILPGVARLRRAPVRGARPVAPVPGGPSAPKDDLVLIALVRFQRRVLWGLVAVCVAIACWLSVSYGPDLSSYLSGDRAILAVASALIVALLVVAICGNLTRLAQIGRAAHATSWTPLRVALDGLLREGATRVNVRGRVWLPDGTERSLRLRGVDVSVAASMQASGVVWVIGAPRANGSLTVGVPGHPLIGFGTVGRKRKTSPS